MLAVAHAPLLERFVIERGYWRTHYESIAGRIVKSQRWQVDTVYSGESLDDLLVHWRTLRRAVLGGWHADRAYALAKVTLDSSGRELGREAIASLPGPLA